MRVRDLSLWKERWTETADSSPLQSRMIQLDRAPELETSAADYCCASLSVFATNDSDPDAVRKEHPRQWYYEAEQAEVVREISEDPGQQTRVLRLFYRIVVLQVRHLRTCDFV